MTNPTDPKAPTANELTKAASRHLRGTIAQEMADTSTGGLSEAASALTKFHGLYLQDDRDKRASLKKEGKEKAFQFMLRVRLPGGRVTPKQWLVLDELSSKLEVGNPSLRVTTRQTFQLHGLLKGNVKPLIQGMHEALLDSISACGDVNRNVMTSPNPEHNALLQQCYDQAVAWSQYALPKSRAYHEIWMDDEMVAGGEEKEPMYGETYLPRKFKTAFALPPHNDVDVFSQDLGFIAVVEDGKISGYNVTVGGGLGMSHGNVDTFPRLGDLMGFIGTGDVIKIGDAVLTTQRDYGDRANRRHARLKYTIEDRGIEWFRGEVEKRSGVTFQPARPFKFTTIQDPTGWHQCADGSWFYGLHILSGRIVDREGWPMKTALREIAQVHKGDFRLTPSQNVTISGVATNEKPVIDAILKEYELNEENEQSGLRLNALSCVALPTCGLALSESERVLPELLGRLETVLDEVGLHRNAISIRITGCPNGCARPYLGEIGFVGRGPNKFALYLGAQYEGTRLNRLFAPSVTLEQGIELLTPVIQRYAKERHEGENFGDFCERAILPEDATFHSVGTPRPAPQEDPSAVI